MNNLKGNIFNIQRFSIHDGPGARTTVFFKGCNLHCIWCHNPESIPERPVVEFYPQKCIGCGACFTACPNGAHSLDGDTHVIDRTRCTGCLACTDTCYAGALASVGREVDCDYVMRQIESDMLYYESSGGGVTFSGGECMLQPDFLCELLTRCHEKGIHTAVDTAGNLPYEYFERILSVADMFLYDVKAADSEVHKRLTGVGNERILANLRRIKEAGARIFVRIPFIPGKNSGEIAAIAALLGEIRSERVELIPYHKLGDAKYSALGLENLTADVVPPDDETVNAALETLRGAGLDARKS